MWFLKWQMPNLFNRINFDLFSKTWNFFAPKISLKYSKKSKNFAMSNVLIATSRTPCKKGTSLSGLVQDALFFDSPLFILSWQHFMLNEDKLNDDTQYFSFLRHTLPSLLFRWLRDERIDKLTDRPGDDCTHVRKTEIKSANMKIEKQNGRRTERKTKKPDWLKETNDRQTIPSK